MSSDVMEDALQGRYKLILEAIEYGQETNFTGIGYGSIKELNKIRNQHGLVAHNAFVTILVEWGLLGAAFLVHGLLHLFLAALRLPTLNSCRSWVMFFFGIGGIMATNLNICYDPTF